MLAQEQFAIQKVCAMPININEKPERKIFGKIKDILRDPVWNGIVGLIAILTALGTVIAFVSSFIPSLADRTQNITLWLLEPFAMPRYIVMGGAFALVVLIVMTTKRYFSSLASISFLQKLNKPVENKPKFVPIPLPAQIANAYLSDRFLDLPSRIITPNNDKVEFQLPADSLILDTNIIIRYVMPRDYGWEEFGFRLPKPVQNIKSVHFLINSGNSLMAYNGFKVGEIKLIFKDTPPIVTDLVIGKNIREWCIGNPGNYVREVSDHLVNNLAWKGDNKEGVRAVMDDLKIPVFEVLRNNLLEQIIFAHNKATKPPDQTGAHFSVFAITLELE